LRTQVAIIGAGPAGLLLSQLLHVAGIDSVVLERRSRAYVEARVRAGVLEQGTVDLLTSAGIGERVQSDGLRHDGIKIAVNGELFRVDFRALTGTSVTVYGQTEITRELIALAIARGTPIVFEAEDVRIGGIDSDKPFVEWTIAGERQHLDCEFVAGCDGQHGISAALIPADHKACYERGYPFGWLGILADCPPCDDEIIYAYHDRGMALASQRSRARSRYYIQVPLTERLEDWPDERLWDEVALRLGALAARGMVRAPAIEKSIAPLRSSVSQPMRHGRLFRAGDAAHIVPPTGAKGLNLAASDVHYLSEALIAHYRDGDASGLDGYSERSLRHVWKAERFSWWFTGLMHAFPDHSPFERRMQMAELDYLRGSHAAQSMLAENYIGLPFD
jgi:p-hydroxybenzoate 3-monooxygenase